MDLVIRTTDMFFINPHSRRVREREKRQTSSDMPRWTLTRHSALSEEDMEKSFKNTHFLQVA